MPSSKKRGGKKAHKKRVNNRNKKITDIKNVQKKHQQEMFNQLIKQYEKQQEEMVSSEEIADNTDQIDGIDGPEI